MENLAQRLNELKQAEIEAFAAWNFIRGRAEECAAIIKLQEDKAPEDSGAESPPEEAS